MKTNVHILNHLCGATEHADELIEKLDTTPFSANSPCFDHVTYTMNVPMGYRDASTKPDMSKRQNRSSININIQRKHPNKHSNVCFDCPCAAGMATVHNCTCANNLASGKCVDEFMRNTVGAILYPQFYAKVK